MLVVGLYYIVMLEFQNLYKLQAKWYIFPASLQCPALMWLIHVLVGSIAESEVATCSNVLVAELPQPARPGGHSMRISSDV